MFRSFYPFYRPGLLLVSITLVLSACQSNTPPPSGIPDVVDYNFHIKPILSNNCFVCHGPDASTLEGDLQLHSREHATARREDGSPAIVPGNASRSALMQRIMAEDPGERMPPLESNKTLSEREIALLARWIEQGAEYKEHWSLLPPETREIPEIENDWSQLNDIDRFIQANLQSAGLTPAPTASKTALIRRLSYVLTGLPPTPSDVQAFVEDESPEAYEKVVDAYLASSHFGERWARHWMDLVRYAESKGHEFDFSIEGTWRYRDYLIRAFNDDVPYDQFIREQLAGDLVESPRRHPTEGYNESVIGTLYYSLGEGTHSPVDLRKDEADRIDNIIDVTTKTFQGLTVSCARCHDHKFDPIPTADYYALYGIFESTRFAPTALLTTKQEAHLDSIKALKADMRQTLAQQWISDLNATPVHQASLAPAHSSLSDNQEEPASTSADSTSSYQMLGDFRDGSLGGWYPHGPAFSHAAGASVVRFNQERNRIDSLTTGFLSSQETGIGIPGALRSPTFVIAHDTLAVVAAGYQSSIRIIIDNFQIIRFPIYGGLELQVDSTGLKTYRFDVSMWKGRKAYAELLVGIYDKKHPVHITDNHLLASNDSSFIDVAYAFAYSGSPPDFSEPPSSATPTPEQALQAWGLGNANADDLSLINKLLDEGSLNSSLDAVGSHLDQIQHHTSQFADVAYVQGVTNGDAIDSHVFDRGNYQMLGEEPIPRRFLTAVTSDAQPFPTDRSGRLEMVEAITAPENPLTARVMVNRLWHHIFGKGLVETVDNFGAQGKLPSHPALLDHMAVHFIDQGWSVKSMIKEMVMSATFQQAAEGTEQGHQLDPNNLLLHHYPVRRLEGEAIRDAILTVSSTLDPTLFGPPVPTHLTEFMQGRGRPAINGPLDGAGRRSIYLSIRRNFLSPMMLAFDMPIPFSTFGNRNSSNVPAQSLTLLNDPFVAEQAEVWAAHLLTLDHVDAAQRIEHIYMTALSRPPTGEETTNAIAFIQQQASRLNLTDEQSFGDATVWTAYCHAILNLKEFIYLV